MNSYRTRLFLAAIMIAFGLSAGSLMAQPVTISTFPWNPDEADQAAEFLVDYGTGPSTGGSAWQNGVISGNRRGSNGAGDQAWANRPTANYQANTVSWLHSPIFDLTGQTGLGLSFELWIQAQNKYDGMKLQVSTNGGSSWNDVSNPSLPYNGNTNTSGLLATNFGGSNTCWSKTTTYGGAVSNTCTIDLNAYAGQSDVRFRFCMVSDGSRHKNGPVLDTFRVEPITASVAYQAGYAAVPQDGAVSADITKTGGSAFTTGMTVSFNGSGVTGVVSSVIDADHAVVDFSASRVADVGAQTFYVNNGGTRICQGTVDVYYPQQLISNRQGGSAQDPPMNGTMVGSGVYAHNGEFRHDLPIVSIPGRMLPLSVGLTYRSRLDTIGSVGAGWSASFDVRLNYLAGSDQIRLYSGAGRMDTFDLQAGGVAGSGPYVLPGFFFTITRNDNGTGADESDDTFTFRYAHGSSSLFEAINLDVSGQQVFRETEFSDRYGNKLTYLYNGAGQLEEMQGDLYDAVFPDRYRLLFEYNSHGRLWKITDYADYGAQAPVIGPGYIGPREWEFIYDSEARLTQIKLPKTENYYSEIKSSGYRTRVEFTYDSNDNLLEVIDARQANETTPLGWLKNHYDGSDRVDYQDVGRTIAADTAHRQTIVYTSGTDVSVVNALGYRSQYVLNANGTASTVRHYTGIWDTGLNLQNNSQVRGSDPADFTTTYLYDSEFHTTKVTYPRGNVAEFRYDITNADQRSRGNLLRVFSGPGSTSTSGLPTDQINGLLATFTYADADHFNLLLTSVNPRDYTVGTNYDIVANAPVGQNNPSEFTTTNTYNTDPFDLVPDGVLESTRTPTVSAGISPNSLNIGQFLESSFTYNSFGQVVTATDQSGVITRYEYGPLGFEQGYLTAVMAGDNTGNPLTTRFTYNSIGRAITVQDPRGFVYTSYINQLDQVVRSETPAVSSAGNAVYFSESDYDLNGNVSEHRVSNFDEFGTAQTPATINTSCAYNILDMIESVTEPIESGVNRSTSFTYDLLYRTAETLLPEGNRSATDYDELNRAIKSYFGFDGTTLSKSQALITSEVYYDWNSNVERSVDGRGNDSHFYFDSYDRLIKSEDRLNTSPNYTTFTYNRAGQVVDSIRYGKKRTYTLGSDTYSFVSNQILARSQAEYDNLGRACMSKTLAENPDGNGDGVGNTLGYSTYENTSGDIAGGWSASRIKFRVNGQIEETRGDLGYPTKYSYDSYNRLLRVTDDRDGAGNEDNYDEYAYDSNSNVLSVTAQLYDDAGPSGNKTLVTTFDYDELNRLIADHSPSVTTYYDTGIVSNGPLSREFKYDSRSNLVRTFDRKGVERITKYDLLDRPVRHQVTDVTRRLPQATLGQQGSALKYTVGYVTENVVSRTVYNKNSDVTESIGPNGNRTKFKYDLAQRWLETQHPDGGLGTPLNTRVGGNSTFFTQVSGTPYYEVNSGGGYDANSNLLNLHDENGTITSFSYDENDLLKSESGISAPGNPFEIEGETGLSYLYDGLYRSVYGETHDGAGSLTEVDSLFNTLSGLERQREKIHHAHPNKDPFTLSRSLVSKFDESGRRYQRDNPSGITRTAWEFDRKHRPTKTHLETFDSGQWLSPGAPIAEYSYLGGGLLHSKHIKRMWQPHPLKGGGLAQFEFTSTFERDNLLRLTKVRHERNDSDIGFSTRLQGAYQYGYDENSMMGFEARWYEDDQGGLSDTPEETDFYYYNKNNELEKAMYAVTQYGAGNPVTMSGMILPYSIFAGDTDNSGVFSDRMYYMRRKSGTRDEVNWYRGAASRTGPSVPSHNDNSYAPDQSTSYDTSDDPNADPDTNPAADGDGSRHNYTVIGKVGMTYDNNRNVLADGTREFRYNYKNQLRRVWRKSDGQSNGLIAKYREDAYGRRVYAQSEWELARRVYFDTRFERDIDMDADNDGTSMWYDDGGIYSFDIAGPGQTQQIASWPSRIERPIVDQYEVHYIDFLVDVTGQVSSLVTPLGFISYEEFELRIYSDRYELWDAFNGILIGTYTPPGGTVGRHNIGLQAGDISVGNGVYIDGVFTGLTGIAKRAAPTIYFGTHKFSQLGGGFPPTEISDTGLRLFENLCYVKSFNRTAPDEQVPGMGPRVTVTYFDGPQPITTDEVYDTSTPNGNNPTAQACVDQEGDPTRNARFDSLGNRASELYLPNGRRTTGQVIKAYADRYVTEGGPVFDIGEGNEVPGVCDVLVTDAVGATRNHHRTSAGNTTTPDSYADGTGNPEGPIYGYDMVSIHQGVGRGPEGTYSSSVSAFAGGASGYADTSTQSLASFNVADRACACDSVDVTQSYVAPTEFDIGTGLYHNNNAGNYRDWNPGILLNEGEGKLPVGKGKNKFSSLPDADEENQKVFHLLGGAKVRLRKINGKWYRPYKVIEYVDDEGKDATQTIWPTPGQSTTIHGEEYHPDEHVVTEEMIKRYEQVSRGGICAPQWVVDAIDLMGSMLGYNDEIGMLASIYAKGGIDQEDFNNIMSGLISGALVAAAVGVVTVGAGYLAGKIAVKAIFKKAVMKLRNKLLKSESGTAREAGKRLDALVDKLKDPDTAEDILQYDKMLDDLRAKMAKPDVTDEDLQAIMAKIYRENAKIGSGSTADAIRHEKATGEQVGGCWHDTKGNDMINKLKNWLKGANDPDNPNPPSAQDIQDAENVIKDIQNALED